MVMKRGRSMAGLALVAAAAVAVWLGGCAASPPAGARMHAMSDADRENARGVLAASAADADELWILERSAIRPGTSAVAAARPVAMLSARPRDGSAAMIRTASRTAAYGLIRGETSVVEVSQWFDGMPAGDFDAEYVFTLPASATVDEFIMTAGRRRIRGIIRERTEAEFLHAEAQRQGYSASKLLLDGAGSFRAGLAMVGAGTAIGIDLRYVQQGLGSGGEREFLFPVALAGAGELSLIVELQDAGPTESIRVSHAMEARRRGEDQSVVVLSLLERDRQDHHDIVVQMPRRRAAAWSAGRGPMPALQEGVLAPGTAFVAVDVMSRSGVGAEVVKPAAP
jgi:hypothetical protein